ncbi:hypothetical protein BpHYR1_032995 [Brachionus plicatilis]|uniref:Uncharacterized protein n=1 Tax=Brachionus plicatilis TaxID=10195 RepID=A0A3M7R0G4_BRAPC|nr:hypothetical protein BpHYR1_032995 [Brachionus plicatilis]
MRSITISANFKKRLIIFKKGIAMIIKESLKLRHLESKNKPFRKQLLDMTCQEINNIISVYMKGYKKNNHLDF